MSRSSQLEIGLLLFPKLTQLDLAGPMEVFTRIPNTNVHLVWKELEPIESDCGLKLQPTTTLAECPALQVLCVPGGPGQVALMDDDTVLAWVRQQGEQAEYVTSVCTGALILGAAGLLHGFHATTHWASLSLLQLFGAMPEDTRICIDGNRITAGGVTSGLDFALRLAAMLTDEETAAAIELSLEYVPQPPFGTGHPDRAPQHVTERVKNRMAPLLQRREEACRRAAAKLDQAQASQAR